MCTSIHVSLLLVLVVCFNYPTLGEPLSGSLNPTPPITQPQPRLNDSNINAVFLSIVNDLPAGSRLLFFVSSFQNTPYLLEPGNPYNRFNNVEITEIRLMYAPLYCSFDMYNPATEGDHERIFWSARQDGIYHSWDNSHWDKRHNWESE